MNRVCCLFSILAVAIAHGDAVTVSVDGTHPGRALPNVQQMLTLWHLEKGAYAHTARNAEWDVTEFAEYVEIMGATGGNPARDCFRNPADRSTLDDYDFSRLVSGCRNIVRLGLKPYLKLGNVPGKFTADYNGGAFSMNIRPPVDFSAYGRYMTACAKALLEAFGRDELLKWRFAVLTEYENADWFKVASGDAEETFRAYCRLYETTVAAFTRTISPDITIGVHAMAVTEGLWDERRFIRYAAERKLPLKFVTASFYDYRPGQFTRGMNLPRTIAHLRDAAVSAGLTNLFYGVDEGRILSSAKGADKGGAQLPLRIVGDTFQAAYDARIAKQIFDSGAEYFASWGYLSGPDTFFEGLPSVSFHVARESARFKGMKVKKLLEIAAGERLPMLSCNQYLAKVGLCSADWLTREVDKNLSGGEVKRIEIATMLARNPKLAIYDEPEAGIDLWSFDRLTETFRQIHDAGEGHSIIIISHQERLIRLADRIVLLEGGRVSAEGPTEEVMPQLGLARKMVAGCALTEPTRLHITEIPTTC